MKKLNGCTEFADICHYACCNHTSKSSYYIWMYPGEYESATKSKEHIEILEKVDGAILGKCKDKEKCDGKEWFKPLDCWSYPFFPFIENGNLVLKVDFVRCPMVEKYDLNEHYIQLYDVWKEIICNREVYHSLELIKMDNYREFFPNL